MNSEHAAMIRDMVRLARPSSATRRDDSRLHNPKTIDDDNGTDKQTTIREFIILFIMLLLCDDQGSFGETLQVPLESCPRRRRQSFSGGVSSWSWSSGQAASIVCTCGGQRQKVHKQQIAFYEIHSAPPPLLQQLSTTSGGHQYQYHRHTSQVQSREDRPGSGTMRPDDNNII